MPFAMLAWPAWVLSGLQAGPAKTDAFAGLASLVQQLPAST